METRKIQLAGGTTYTVSLPKEWASKQDLEAGAQVRVHPYTDGSLLVQTMNHEEPEGETLQITTDDVSIDTLQRQIRASYQTGRETIEVTGDELTPKDQRELRNVAASLLGVDLVQQSDNVVVYKSLLDAGNISIEQSLHQLQFIADSTIRDVVLALIDDDMNPQNIDDRASEATRLVSLISRQYNRSLDEPGILDDLEIDRKTLSDYHLVATELERIVNHATRIGTMVQRQHKPIPNNIAKKLEMAADEARNSIERSMGVLLDNGTAETASEIIENCEDVTTMTFDQLGDDGMSAWLGVILQSLTNIVQSSGAIAEISLQAALSRTTG